MELAVPGSPLGHPGPPVEAAFSSKVLEVLCPVHRAERLTREEWELWERSLCGVLTRVLQGRSIGL